MSAGVAGKASPEQEEDDCSICLTPLQLNIVTPNNCKHQFHEVCLINWFKGGIRTCPICRSVAEGYLKNGDPSELVPLAEEPNDGEIFLSEDDDSINGEETEVESIGDSDVGLTTDSEDEDYDAGEEEVVVEPRVRAPRRRAALPCDVCGRTDRPDETIMCRCMEHAAHMNCARVTRVYRCPNCRGQNNDSAPPTRSSSRRRTTAIPHTVHLYETRARIQDMLINAVTQRMNQSGRRRPRARLVPVSSDSEIEGASDDEVMLLDEPSTSSAPVPRVVPRRKRRATKGRGTTQRKKRKTTKKKTGTKKTKTKRKARRTTRRKKNSETSSSAAPDRAYREPVARLSVLGEGIEPPISFDEPLTGNLRPNDIAITENRPRRVQTDPNDLLGSILVDQTETLAHGNYFTARDGQFQPRDSFFRHAGKVMSKMSNELKESIGPLNFGDATTPSSSSTSGAGSSSSMSSRRASETPAGDAKAPAADAGRPPKTNPAEASSGTSGSGNRAGPTTAAKPPMGRVPQNSRLLNLYSPLPTAQGPPLSASSSRPSTINPPRPVPLVRGPPVSSSSSSRPSSSSTTTPYSRPSQYPVSLSSVLRDRPSDSHSRPLVPSSSSASSTTRPPPPTVIEFPTRAMVQSLKRIPKKSVSS